MKLNVYQIITGKEETFLVAVTNISIPLVKFSNTPIKSCVLELETQFFANKCPFLSMSNFKINLHFGQKWTQKH